MGVSRSFTLLIVLFCYIIVYISLKIIINYFNPNYLIYLNMYSIYYICFIVTLLLALSFNYYINENNINTIIPQAPDLSSSSTPSSSTPSSSTPSSSTPSSSTPSSSTPSSSTPSSSTPSNCRLDNNLVDQVINQLNNDSIPCDEKRKIKNKSLLNTHPDRNPGCPAESTKATQQINETYELKCENQS